MVLFIILVVSDVLGEPTVNALEIKGYQLEDSRVESEVSGELAWAGKFRSNGKGINVYVHYNTDLREPTEYSYQIAKQDGLVLTMPFKENANALYWNGFKEDSWLFVRLEKHTYEFSFREDEQWHPVQAQMPPAEFARMEMDSKAKGERLKELRGPKKDELFKFARGFLSKNSVLATRKQLHIEDIRFASQLPQVKGKVVRPSLPSRLLGLPARIDLPFREGEKLALDIFLKEGGILFFPKMTKPVMPIPCEGCEVAIKLPQYNVPEKWVTQKTDPKGNLKLEFEVDNVTKKTIIIRNSDGEYQFTANLYIRYGRPVETYLDGKKKREFADTPEGLDLQKLKNLILDDLDLAYDPDENRFGKGELSREALAVIKNSFPDRNKLRYLPFEEIQPMVFTKEELKGLLQRLKEPFVTEKTWRSSETDPFYWDIRTAIEVGQAVYLAQGASVEGKEIVREIADTFLNKTINLGPSHLAIDKTGTRYEARDETFAPHFYAVITLAKAYEIFNDRIFRAQAVKQIQLAEEEFFKSQKSASLEDLIRLGQAYKVLSRYQASLVQGCSFLSAYKDIAALSLIQFKDWRNERLRNNDLHASFFDMELKLLHLLLPEFHFETDI